MDFNGKNIIYIGGTGGIGVATAKQLLKKPIANLVLLDKVENKDVIADLAAINPKISVHFFSLDLTDGLPEITKVFEKIVKKVGTMNILINGAGIFNEHLIDATININLLGVINSCIVAFKMWDKRTGGNGGTIVNIASAAGISPHPAIPVYSATKAGIIAFTKATSQLIDKSGITTFVICPGPTATPMIHQVNTFLDYIPEMTQVMNSMPRQSPDVLAANLLKVMETYENGSVWILDNDQILRAKDTLEWSAPDLYELNKSD